MKNILIILLFHFSIHVCGQRAVCYTELCEPVSDSKICRFKTNAIFQIIKNSSAFSWDDENNNCEDRANAVSLILDSWGIPNGKAWIFQGVTFDRNRFSGELGGYRYHVASAILIKNSENKFDTLIIDPLMDSNAVMPISRWANEISVTSLNVYFITSNMHYQQREVSPTPNWTPRDQHFEDTIDGLTRYNNFSWWTRLRTKKYLRNRQGVLPAYNNLISQIPVSVSSIICN